MLEARITTEIWIKALLRRHSNEGIHAVVSRKGDLTAGSVLIRLDHREIGIFLFAQTRTITGEQAWFQPTGPGPIIEEHASYYIQAAIQRDPDLWVIDIDDRHGRHLLTEAIISI